MLPASARRRLNTSHIACEDAVCLKQCMRSDFKHNFQTIQKRWLPQKIDDLANTNGAENASRHQHPSLAHDKSDKHWENPGMSVQILRKLSHSTIEAVPREQLTLLSHGFDS